MAFASVEKVMQVLKSAQFSRIHVTILTSFDTNKGPGLRQSRSGVGHKYKPRFHARKWLFFNLLEGGV